MKYTTAPLFALAAIAAPLLLACSREQSLSVPLGDRVRFPDASIFYQDISQAPLDPNSSSMMAAIADAGGFGASVLALNSSLTILNADRSAAIPPFASHAGYYPGCDEIPFPLVPGMPDVTAAETSVVLIHQGSLLYEVYYEQDTLPMCEAVWDLNHDYWTPGADPYGRGDQCTGADSSGMPIAHLLVTEGDLVSGVVDHALRLSLPAMEPGVYVHPATHGLKADGTGAQLPPIGSRLRLRASFPITALKPYAQLVAIAFQKYGAFLVDEYTGSISVDPSALTLLDPLDLSGIVASDLEVVMPQDGADAGVPVTFLCNRTSPRVAP